MSRAAASDRPVVVVTFQPNDERRAAFQEVLIDVAEVVVLPDVAAERRVQALRRARAVITWFPNPALSDDELRAIGSVPFIQLLSAGADTVPFDILQPGVVLAANVGAYAAPIAEHAVAMALALAKRLPQKHAELTRGVFEQLPPTRWIAGSVCGVVGFGGIGKATARLMAPLGARIQAINTSGRTDEPVDFCGTLADLDRVLAASDVVVIAIPLTPATTGLIGAEQLARMKPDAILVNVARGAIVDQGRCTNTCGRTRTSSQGSTPGGSNPSSTASSGSTTRSSTCRTCSVRPTTPGSCPGSMRSPPGRPPRTSSAPFGARPSPVSWPRRASASADRAPARKMHRRRMPPGGATCSAGSIGPFASSTTTRPR